MYTQDVDRYKQSKKSKPTYISSYTPFNFKSDEDLDYHSYEEQDTMLRMAELTGL
jgi:hypothetical protein